MNSSDALDQYLVVGVVLAVIWTLINVVILRRKNRALWWALLGFVVGPISVLVVVLLPAAG